MINLLRNQTTPFLELFVAYVIQNTPSLGERRLFGNGFEIDKKYEMQVTKPESRTSLLYWKVETPSVKWEQHIEIDEAFYQCLYQEKLDTFPLYIRSIKTVKENPPKRGEEYGVPNYHQTINVTEMCDAITLGRNETHWIESLNVVKRVWDEMVLEYQQEVAKQAISLFFFENSGMTHSFIPKETLSRLQPNQYREDNQQYLIIPTRLYLKLQALTQIKSQQVNILVKVEENDTLPDVHYSAEVIGVLLDMNGVDYIYPIKTVGEFEHYVKSTGLSEKVKLNDITLNDCTFPHDNRYYQSKHNRLRLSGDFFGKQYTLRDRYTASPTDNKHGITWYLDISYPTVLSNKWVGQCLIRLTGVDTNRKLSSTKTLEWDNGWMKEDVVVSKTHILYLKDFNEVPYLEQIKEQLNNWLPTELTSLKLMHWDIHDLND